MFIPHNPHHAYPVRDGFMLLRRGASLGDFAKSEISLSELADMMAGGTELQSLAHELSREWGADSPLASEVRGEGPRPSDM